MIAETGATVVCSTPTYALRMAQEAQAHGHRPGRRARSGALILSGEPAGSIPATKALIEEQWGAKAADTAGMTELGTIIIFECDASAGRDAHHRGPLPRGGRRPRDATSRSATASWASAS